MSQQQMETLFVNLLLTIFYLRSATKKNRRKMETGMPPTSQKRFERDCDRQVCQKQQVWICVSFRSASIRWSLFNCS